MVGLLRFKMGLLFVDNRSVAKSSITQNPLVFFTVGVNYFSYCFSSEECIAHPIIIVSNVYSYIIIIILLIKIQRGVPYAYILDEIFWSRCNAYFLDRNASIDVCKL
jgi:hypothetical protein